MLRWQHQQIRNETMREWSTFSSLLSRIRKQCIRDAWNRRIKHIGKTCLNLFIFFIVLLIFQCPSRVYNAWKGPFPMNLKQFHNHLEMSYNLIDFQSFFFQYEYIQIELGKNVLDESMKNTLRIFYGHHSYEQLLYTFNRVQEPTIDTRDMTLFVKFAAHEQSHSQKRYSYHFQSFSVSTLRCIVEQLAISSTEFMQWPEKSIYIEKIEQIYNNNPTVFNRRVIRKCGILIGYLYRPTNEYFYPGDSYEYHQFSIDVQVFNASSSYTPYMSYVLIGLFIYFLLKSVAHLVRDIIHLIYRPFSIVHSYIQKQMTESNINSLANLDNLLLNTTDENNHYDRLFIIHGKYLIMLMVDLHENNEEILRRFYENTPLNIIPIDSIRNIRQNCIMLDNNSYSRWIDFPTRSYSSRFNPSDWLHQRLMILNDEYRYTWEREEELRHQEETRRAQANERRELLSIITAEEAEYQRRHYGNDINRILHRITSASPHFIAQFRLADRQMVTDSLLDTTCTICLDNFQLNQHFAQWPCTAKHTFHFDCMLDVLRAGSTCPLCRYPVEAAGLPSIETAVRLLFGRMINDILP